MPAVSVPTEAPLRPRLSKRELSLAADGVLLEHMRSGNELAFEIAFERHGGAVLSFCRHMLSSAQEAEDAVQHSFASAWRDLERGGERELALRPWLFTIARNRCLSVLRARRPQTQLPELATAGLSDEVERRAELRELLRDIGELPTDQREALLLSELGDLSHAAVAGVLGCEVARVKSLVFRARSTLIARRDARATPCEQIREQLANLRGGSLRRNELRFHLSACPACRAYRAEVKRQRELLAAALPVTPGSGLELAVLAAAGIGGGGAAIGGAAAGGAAAAGAGAVLSGAGSTLLTKLALVGLMAGGGVTAGTVLVDDPGSRSAPTRADMHQRATGSGGDRAATPGERGDHAASAKPVKTTSPAATRSVLGAVSAQTNQEDGALAGDEPQPAGASPERAIGGGRGRKPGHAKQATREAARPVEVPGEKTPHGRGRVEKTTGSVPVRRGPTEAKAPAITKPPTGPKPSSAPKPKAPAVPKAPTGRKPSSAPKPKAATPTPKAPSGVPAPAAPPAEQPADKQEATKP